MGVYKKGSVYWFIKHYRGRRYEESLHTDSKRLADELYAKALTAILRGEYGKREIEPCNFETLADKYLEWKRTRVRSQRSCYNEHIALKCFTVMLKGREVNSITTRELEQIQTDMMEKNKPATVNRKFDVFKHMFTKAGDWEMATEETLKRVRKVKDIPVNNKRLRYLSKEECQELLTHCDSHLKPIVIMALNTGCRRGEILSLKWDNVDLKHGFILLDKTKNGDRREIPINDTLRAALQGITRRLDITYVFHDAVTGKPYGDIKRSFHTALRRSGIKDFHFHDLRHTFASHLVMSGVDITSVSRLLGHKSLTMTLRYSHLAPAHLKQAVQSLNYYDFTTVGGSEGFKNAVTY